jgi:phosphonopyruvate decarboxylase
VNLNIVKKIYSFFGAENNVDCFCGVPDSLLKDFCAYITDNVDAKNHTITANEGNAIALASGHYLATGKPALVYMQNSGIGNCVNPLLSLTDDEVYNIPLLMFIGWRGEPDKKDEPQHVKQGKVTDKLLDAMGIKYAIMPESFEDVKPLIEDAFKYMKETKCPFVFIIKKGLFEKYSLQNKKQNSSDFKREDAIETVINALSEKDVIVATTGHISREVYETRNRLGQSHKQDFLTVGSMGHSSSIALGIALEKPERNVYCFDGDGAFLMHQGAIVVNASKNLSNFKHIVFNNEAHDSVGSQPTAIDVAKLDKIALDAGYCKSYSVSNKDDLLAVLPQFIADKCTSLLEIKVKCGAREDLGRPKEKPWENKELFMENLND